MPQKDQTIFDLTKLTKRWFSCFDLLGSSRLAKTSEFVSVFVRYRKVIDEFLQNADSNANIGRAWFSDTFVIYAPDASKAGFFAIENASQWFTTFLILREIPVRGAMSCDEIYVDRDSQVYLGKGLIEAYEYGDGQDWLGFVLCPSASRQLSDLALSPDEQLQQDVRPSPSMMKSQVRVLSPDEQLQLGVRERYVRWPVIMKNRNKNFLCARKHHKKFLHACKLGRSFGREDEKQLVRALERMRSRETKHSIKKKYTRTIDFLKKMDSRRYPSA
jgi:hypothetical protein